MYSFASASCYTRSSRWSTIRSAIYFESSVELFIPKIQSSGPGRIPNDDWSCQNVSELFKLLEFRKPQCALQGIIAGGCVNVQNKLHKVERINWKSKCDVCWWKVSAFRWLVFCHVPAFCNSLTHFETTQVFGRTLLKAVFKVRQQFVSHWRPNF